jgi:hypothetical protein
MGANKDLFGKKRLMEKFRDFTTDGSLLRCSYGKPAAVSPGGHQDPIGLARPHTSTIVGSSSPAPTTYRSSPPQPGGLLIDKLHVRKAACLEGV